MNSPLINEQCRSCAQNKERACGKAPCAPAAKGCVTIMTSTGLKEGCVYLCSCGTSKLLRAQRCDVKGGSFECNSLCVMGLVVRAEPSFGVFL